MLCEMERIRRDKGLALIELMIIFIMIGLLAAIAITQFAAYSKRMQDSAAKSALKSLAIAQQNYYAENNIYTSDLTKLKGWTAEPEVKVSITGADDTAWSATASHISSSFTFIYVSSAGGIQ